MDVGAWLKRLELEEYAEAFARNGVDAALLPDLTNEDLKDLGVARLADRKRLLNAIAGLSDGQPSGEVRPPLPSPSPEGEHRQVTVLFADLTGFTQLSNELGAEETYELLNRYFEAVDRIVEAYGGSIDKHIGDSVMAVFGAPVAHDNDPERAVRSALDIHAAMTGLSAELGRRLAAHIGIATGQVVASGTGSQAHRQYTVTGDTVNLASRLQDRAKGGETLISDEVHRAAQPLVICAGIGELVVKGFSRPTMVWRLEGLQTGRRSEAQIPFVGRRGERRRFAAILEDCGKTGTGQSVLVRGDAGIGKSRLVEQFMAMAEGSGFACHRGLILDFGVGQGQDAIRTLVRRLLGLAGASAEARRVQAADSAVRDGLVERDQRAFLNDLLDLPQPMELRSLYDAMDNTTRTSGKQAVVTRLVEEASRARPQMVVFEDVHWADSVMLAYLARLAVAVAGRPAILVMTSRVEDDPLDQAWRSSLRGSPLATIDLGPLRDSEAMEIASAFNESDNRLLRTCIDRADGNPLFLEQLLRNAEEGAQEEVPGSIQSLVQARMDRLQPADREALQAASVIGQRFASDVVRYLLGKPDYECAALLAHNLVGRQEDGYLFAHALIRDGVYASLLKRRRRALHLRAAKWFAERDPQLRAEHLERAGDPAAASAYLEAAEAQAESYHYERAMQLIGRGLALTASPAATFALTCLEGRMLHDLGSINASIEAYQRALDMAEDDEARCRAWLGLAAGMRISDRYEDALAALGHAEPSARRHGLVRELAEIHHLRGNLYFPMGRIAACRAEHETSLTYALESGSAEAEAHALSGLGDADYVAGRMASAHDHFRRCVEVARRNGFGRIEVANRSMVGFSRVYLNELREALDDGEATVEAATRVGDQRAEMLGEMLIAFVRYEMADYDHARRHNARALALARQLGAPRFEAQCLMLDGKLAYADGRHGDAIAILETALTISEEVGHGFSGPRIMSELARNLADPQAKRAALRKGERMLEAGSVSHNHFYFFLDAIQVSLDIGDWGEVERYAAALEDFAGSDGLPWSRFFSDYGRALAAWGGGNRGPAETAEIERLRDEAERVGFNRVLPALEDALKAG
jgi:class 3 adenylate cyclase/tetratricopeptide (TPR) repeat protein